MECSQKEMKIFCIGEIGSLVYLINRSGSELGIYHEDLFSAPMYYSIIFDTLSLADETSGKTNYVDIKRLGVPFILRTGNYSSILICFDPNVSNSFESAKEIYDVVQKHITEDRPAFLICSNYRSPYMKDTATIIQNAQSFASQKGLLFYTLEETIRGGLYKELEMLVKAKIAEENFNHVFKDWEALTVPKFNAALLLASTEYCKNSIKTPAVSFFSFGLIPTAAEVCSQRTPICLHASNLNYALVSFLTGEGALNHNSLKFLVLKDMFPNITACPEEKLPAAVSYLIEKLKLTPQFQATHKSIIFFLCMKKYEIPTDIRKLIINVFLSIPLSEKPNISLPKSCT